MGRKTKKIELTTFYPFPPEIVWQALTDPRAIGSWLMDNDFEPRVGKKFKLSVTKRVPGWRGFVECEVLKLDPPREMVWSWVGIAHTPPLIVTYRLENAAGGTQLTFIQDGFTSEHGFLAHFILKMGSKRMYRQMLPLILEHIVKRGVDAPYDEPHFLKYRRKNLGHD